MKTQPWVEAMDLAFAEHCSKQEMLAEDQKYQEEKIQVALFRAWVKEVGCCLKNFLHEKDVEETSRAKATEMLQQIHSFQEYAASRGWKFLAEDELCHLSLLKGFKSDRKRMEITYRPGTRTSQLCENVLFVLVKDQGGYKQVSTEPKGDMERKLQAWLDSIRVR